MSTTRSIRPPEDPQDGQPGIPSASTNGHHAAPPRQPLLTGRARELVLLHALLDQALAGTGGIAMLAGEPGAGKTRLLEELAAAARDHASVRWGRCYEGEGAPAYWPWVQVLRACVLDTDPHTLRADLAGGASLIAQIVPEIAERLPDLPPPPPLEPEQARFRLFDAIATFLHNTAARRPLLLILDDLHWADTPSLLLLRFLSKEVRETPMLLACAYRDVDLTRGHPLTQTMGELARVQACHRLALHGLDAADVARFIEAAAGHAVPPALAEAVYQRTEGNPFFLTEIVRLLIAEGHLARAGAAEREPAVAGFLDASMEIPLAGTEPGIPQTVREAIDRRLDQLGERCRAVLAVAAVLGLEFTLPALERVASASGIAEGVLEALEEAEEARIITGAAVGSGRYRFANALIRDTVYEGLTTTRRVRLHRQAGEALESLWSGALDAHLGELASHFAQAAPSGCADRAVFYARRAAERAAALTGYEEAARYYGMALHALVAYEPGNVTLRCDLVLELGEAHWKAGDGATARDSFRDAATLARAIPAPDRLGWAALGFTGPATLVSGPGVVDGESAALLEEALAALPVEDSPLRALLLARLAQAMQVPGGQQRRDTLSRAAVEMARRLGDPATSARTLIARHHALLGAPNVWDRFAAATAIIRLGGEAGDRELALQGHAALVLDLMELGDGQAADEAIATCAALCDELRQPVHAYIVATFRAMRALTAGQFAEAERLAQRAVILGQPVERQRAVHAFALLTFSIRRDQGRLAEVEDGVLGFVQRYPSLPGWRAALALLYAETGRPAEARTEFERLAEDGFAGLPRDAFWLVAVSALGEVCGYLGDAEQAARLYELLAPHDGHIIVAGHGTVCAGAAAHYLGVLAATAGLPDVAARHFAEALEAHARLGSQPLLARTRYAWARLHAAGGTADGELVARELAQDALRTAGALGMALLEAQARELLHEVTAGGDGDQGADGQAARLPRAAYPNNLTPREVEVLRLLAGGMTTREIAEHLVVSVHTVTRHIANIYTKIGARNRADATIFAIQHGLL